MNEEKVFIGTGKIKEFDTGGSILKYALGPKDVETIVKAAEASESGWVNIDIKSRLKISDKGVTHYGELNTWKKPGAKANNPISNIISEFEEGAKGREVPF